MEGVFANRTARRDFVVNELERCGVDSCNIYIASAFFTESSVVQDFLDKGCNVWLVVRLGFPTSPRALAAVMDHRNLKLRFYSSRAFHPKLYIFGDQVALVGSANLTRSAITSNQEVMVSVGAEDARFAELAGIFQEYWDDADVLTPEKLKVYADLYRKYTQFENAAENLAIEAANRLGNTAPRNIDRGEKKASKQSLFFSDFQRAYQEGVAAFNIVRDVYKASAYRKASEDDIPLRLEIDSFISFVREREATGDAWEKAPYRSRAEQEPLIRELIEKWRVTPWLHFEHQIVGENYPRLNRVFESPATIKAASDEELFEGLATLHSFYDRFRFFEGGLKTWRLVFPKANDPTRTRESLVHLLFGSGDVVQRMSDLIFDPRYKLNEFGRANVQELVGWRNREDFPILNGRTTKVLRFFGSRVKQVQ